MQSRDFSEKNTPPASPSKRFLLIRTDRIGDTVLTLPAVTVLRARFPEAFIAFLALPYTVPLLRQYVGIDLVLSYEPQGRHQGRRGLMKLSRELSELQFDAALLFYPRPGLAFALAKARIAVRIGSGFRWYSFLLTKRIYEHRKKCQKHEAEYNLSLLSPLLTGETPRPRFAFKEWTPETWWEAFRKELGGADYAIVHPGSGASAPNLNKEQYRFLLSRLLEETQWSVLLTGSSGEQSLVEELAVDFPEERVKTLAGRFALEEFLSVIRNARLLISGSTGPLHLANAAETPLLGFFCPAKPHTPQRWGPYNQQQWAVMPNLNGPEICRLSRCPYGGCLAQLSELELLEALHSRIGSPDVTPSN